MTNGMTTTDATYSHWLHRVAVLTAAGVFPLIFVGAGVTSNDAGMAYPDWPTSGGYLINPPQWWAVVATRWEHGHRLIGWAVGALATATAMLTWRKGGAIRWMGLGTFAAIAIQGVLGGLRVNLISTSLAMAHGIWGQLCFCLAAATALITSPRWRLSGTITDGYAAAVLRRLCPVATCVIAIQLILGAALRHFGGTHAMIAHLAWALVVVLLVGWVAMWVMAQYSDHSLLAALGRVVAILIVAQLLTGGLTLVVTLGNVSVADIVRWVVPSVHVCLGALLLVASLLLTMCVHRFLVAPTAQETEAPEKTPAVATR
ncbi:MAG: hypothetical protein ACE5HE_07940 [Phycisphaerae bacterium]